MKKYLIIIAACVIIGLLGYYFLGPEGGLAGLLGLGANGVPRGDKRLEEQADNLREEIAELEEDLLEEVEDLTDEQVEDYWNK